ncbi:MAG TPA: hypothetical protein VIC26_06235 [Marinagarivorans sp.]
MPIKKIFITFAVLSFLTFKAHAEENSKALYIATKKPSEFDVMYSRVSSNMTGAAIGGLIGAGIQAGVESSKDAERRESLQPHVPKDIWETAFNGPLYKKFERANFKILEKDGKNGISIQIIPEMHGFKVVDTNTKLMSAFISFQAKFYKNGKLDNTDNYYLIHKQKHSFEGLTEDPEKAMKQLESIIRKGARRLANKVIYSNKEN